MVVRAKHPVPEPQVAQVPDTRPALTEADAARIATRIIQELNMFLPDADCHRTRAADVVAAVLLSESRRPDVARQE